ncbi:MAG: MATE family efflux transporter [Oscillospiraceae bacterium]|nr:MATE family efflux transporter [Oscillospiraceae bacterium]
MNQDNSLAMFEKEPIVKLMLKFALPAIAAMVVNSIYNIVDQIFIGQAVGMLGNAATNLTFPLVTISMAIGTMIADGCVAYFSLKLGQRSYDEAARTMGNGIAISLLAGLFITLSMELFLQPVLRLCGGNTVSARTFEYAVEYARITLIGIPFVCVSMTVSSIIRAQGSPRYAMLCNIAGCITNIILDAWFVLGLRWGVAGAAWATIIGQALNFGLAIAYIPRLKGIQFRLEYARLRAKTVFSFLPLGISSFFTQFGSTIVVICMNNLIVTYGAESIYGPDIPLAAQGIVMKVNSIIVSVMVGLGIGSQPIVGYNYGARNFRRVKETYLKTIVIGLAVGVVGWACFQLFTQSIVNLFGQESELYNQFALKCFHIFLAVIFLTGFIIPSGIFFQSIGKPTKAMICTLTRQLIYFLPAAFVLGHFMGIEGLLYAGPVGDVLASATIAILVAGEIRILNRDIKNTDP